MKLSQGSSSIKHSANYVTAIVSLWVNGNASLTIDVFPSYDHLTG